MSADVDTISILGLRERKMSRLSGEACAKLRALAEPAPGSDAETWRTAVAACPACSDATLSRAIRRYDLDGYGVIKAEVFSLALRAAGLALDGFRRRGTRGVAATPRGGRRAGSRRRGGRTRCRARRSKPTADGTAD